MRLTFSVYVTMIGALFVGLSYAGGSELANAQNTAIDQQTSAVSERTANRRAQLVDADTSEQRTARVAARCRAAQTKLQPLAQSAAQVKRNRIDAYENVSTKLNLLLERVPETIDTTNLESQIGKLDVLIKDFATTFAEYELAFSDATAVDCEENVEEFILALEDIRVKQALLKREASTIRSLITSDIFNDILQIKDALGASSEEA